MTDKPTPATEPAGTPARPAWTAPVIEEIGSIHDVEGGTSMGNDGADLPPRNS